MKRIVGMAYAGPDGALYWQGVDNVDTATCECHGWRLISSKRCSAAYTQVAGCVTAASRPPPVSAAAAATATAVAAAAAQHLLIAR